MKRRHCQRRRYNARQRNENTAYVLSTRRKGLIIFSIIISTEVIRKSHHKIILYHITTKAHIEKSAESMGSTNDHNILDVSESATKSTFDPSIHLGRYRYYYDTTFSAAIDTLFIFGVESSMEVEEYSDLAKTVVSGRPILFVTLDAQSSDPVKFGDNVNELVHNLALKFPDVQIDSNRKIIIGGHSASGWAAISSFQDLNFKPDAYIGLDPFPVNTVTMKIPYPALLWGFKKKPCGSDVDRAANAAFEISLKGKRVYYQIQNEHGKIAHSVFANDGCHPKVILGVEIPDYLYMGQWSALNFDSFTCLQHDKEARSWLLEAVAKSVGLFALSLQDGEFSRERFLLAIDGSNGEVDLHVD